MYTILILSLFACYDNEKDSAEPTTEEPTTEEPTSEASTEPSEPSSEASAEPSEPSSEENNLEAGRALVEGSCTNSCHAGANMGNYSSRFPDDAELGRVIRGQNGGPMGGVTSANGWSDDDMTNAIGYMRSLE